MALIEKLMFAVERSQLRQLDSQLMLNDFLSCNSSQEKLESARP